MKKFCLALSLLVAFLLCWFSLWLHLIIFIGGCVSLFSLMLAIEKDESKDD